MQMGWVLARSPNYPWMSGSVLAVLVDGSFTGLLSAHLSAPTVERSWTWINIDLVGYVSKLLWSLDSLHHSQPFISSVLNLLAHQCYERQELAQQENTILASASGSNLLSWSAPQFQSISGVHRQWVGNRSCCWGSQVGAVCSDAFVFAGYWLHPVCSTEKESLLGTKPKALDQLPPGRESTEGHLLLSSFPLLSLRWWEVPPDRTRRGLISLSLHCTQEPFAYLHGWFKKL